MCKNVQIDNCILSDPMMCHNNATTGCNRRLVSSFYEEGSSFYEEVSSKKEEVWLSKKICFYCKKYIVKQNISRHSKICKERDKYELHHIIKENKLALREKDNKIKELEDVYKLKEDIEKEFFQFMKDVAKNGNNITLNNNKNYNMFYIMNNYKNPNCYDALMDPKLTNEEILYIKEHGPMAGSFKLLTSRCIDNIPVDKRPFHCVDFARGKYLAYIDVGWLIDKNAEKIIDKTINKVRSVFDVIVDIDDTTEVVNRKMKDMGKLIVFERTGRKRLLKELNKIALLRNNIK